LSAHCAGCEREIPHGPPTGGFMPRGGHLLINYRLCGACFALIEQGDEGTHDRIEANVLRRAAALLPVGGNA